VEYEYSKAVIDAIRSNQIVEESRGREEGGNQWEERRIVDHNAGASTVEKVGKNPDGEWKEQWSERGDSKWARKEGKLYTSG